MNKYKKGNKVVFRKNTNYKTRKAYPPQEAVVIQILEGNRVKVKTKQGKIQEIGYPTHVVYRLVPQSKIPKYWKETLKLNPKAKVYVVYLDHTEPDSTTLVCKETLRQLWESTRSEERAEIKLWDKDTNASKGKPEIQDSDTEYLCGTQKIQLPEEPSRYS